MRYSNLKEGTPPGGKGGKACTTLVARRQIHHKKQPEPDSGYWEGERKGFLALQEPEDQDSNLYSHQPLVEKERKQPRLEYDAMKPFTIKKKKGSTRKGEWGGFFQRSD